MLAGRLPGDRNDRGDLRCRARAQIAEPDDDAQSIGISERTEEGVERRGPCSRGAHTRASSVYRRTRSFWMAQPSLLASNEAERRACGMASKPDSVMVSSTPSSVSDRVNSTSVVGSES